MDTNIRDSVIAVRWQVEGQEEIQETDETLQSTAASAAMAGDSAEEAGGQMAEAGEDGSRGFSDAADSAGRLDGKLAAISATAVGVGLSLLAATRHFVGAAADLEMSAARIEAFAGESTPMVLSAAEELQAASMSYFAAGDAMAGQAEMLRRGVDATIVAQLTPALGNLAMIAGEELPSAFRLLSTAMLRPERGFITLGRSGLLMQETVERLEAEFRDLSAATDSARMRQMILNAVISEGTSREREAALVRDTLTGSTNALWAELGNLSEMLGEELAEEWKGAIDSVVGLLQSIRELDSGFLGLVGRIMQTVGLVLTFGGAVAGAKVVAKIFGVGVIAGAVALGKFGAIVVLVAIGLTELISFLVRGESAVFDYGVAWEWLKGIFGGFVGMADDFVGHHIRDFIDRLAIAVRALGYSFEFVFGMHPVDIIEAIGDAFRAVGDAVVWTGGKISDLFTSIIDGAARAANVIHETLLGEEAPWILQQFWRIRRGDDEDALGPAGPTEFEAGADRGWLPRLWDWATSDIGPSEQMVRTNTTTNRNSRSEITVRLEANGDTMISRENARQIGDQLMPRLMREVGLSVEGGY